jgi:hypothetical protein
LETPAGAQAKADAVRAFTVGERNSVLSAVANLAVRQWLDDMARIGASENSPGWIGEAFLIGDDRVESATLTVSRGAGSLTGGSAALPAGGALERQVTLNPVVLPSQVSRR